MMLHTDGWIAYVMQGQVSSTTTTSTVFLPPLPPYIMDVDGTD